MKRILVTGSREWHDIEWMKKELKRAVGELKTTDSGIVPNVVLVHGDCPSGADAMADTLWRQFVSPDQLEAHPAKWNVDGKVDKTAGFKRNQEMVDTKPDLVLAFQTPCSKKDCKTEGWHYSHGAQHTIDAAEAAGLEVRIYRDPPF